MLKVTACIPEVESCSENHQQACFPSSVIEKGIQLVQEGQYSQAAGMFTEAIKCDPKDYRYVC